MKLDTNLKLAIEQAVCEIFDEGIPLNDPYETTSMVISTIESYLNCEEEDLSE